MKKTLLSMLAGLVVIGSASAVPSPEDRRKLCEQNPDKFVWVEKTQACIPINPCLSNVSAIEEAYCIQLAASYLPNDQVKRDMIIERYVEKNLHTSVVKISEVPGVYNNGLFDELCVGVYTADGGYFAMPYDPEDNFSYEAKCMKYVGVAMNVYGYGDFMPWEAGSTDDGKLVFALNIPRGQRCEDIKDFVSLLWGDLVEQDMTQEGCVLLCPEDHK